MNKKSIKNFIIHLWKNPLIGLAFLIIFAAIFVSISGANIRPDSSVDANSQIPQIARQKPGTTISFLKLRKNKQVEEKNIFQKLFFGGEESKFSLVPFYDYEINDTHIVLREFTADSSSINYTPSYIRYDLYDVIESANPVLGGGVVKEILVEEYIVTKVFYFGTDKHGRDLLSRLMAGTIVSLFIGFISVLISLCLGLF